jgi:uncharacterized membrane protein required for colicin V production
MNWLFLVIMAILIVNTLIGRKVGMVKMVFSLCSMVVALGLTALIHPLVNNWMMSNGKLYESVANKIAVVLLKEKDDAVDIDFEEKQESSEQMGQEPATTAEEESYIDKLQLPQVLKKSLLENKTVNSYKEMAVNNIKQYICHYLAGVVVKALSFIVTFILAFAIIWVLSFSLNLISKLPVLNQINKTAGACAGLLQGLVMVWIFFLIVTVLGGTLFGRNTLEMIEGNAVLSFIYDHNLLLKFVTGATKLVP